jgi:hypothetical protein
MASTLCQESRTAPVRVTDDPLKTSLPGGYLQ